MAAPTTERPRRQEQEPASAEITEMAPGILRSQLPITLPGLGHVNCYFLEDERGVAIVDPGLPGPSSWRALVHRLKAALGVGASDDRGGEVRHGFLPVGRARGWCGQGVEPATLSTRVCSSSRSASSRSDSGGRTGPAGRPTAARPALTIDTE